MKRAIAAVMTIIITLLLFSSCDGEFINELSEALSATPSPEATAPETTPAATEIPAPPFGRTPELLEWEMPEEEFKDELEAKASEIIDDAIIMGVRCTLTMKDSRHSYVTFPYEAHPSGRYDTELNDRQRLLYDNLREKLINKENFVIKQKDYGKDLIVDQLTISTPLELDEPELSAFTYLGGGYDYVEGLYFDPYKWANDSVKSGRASMDKINEDMALFRRIVERIIRFMPEDLTAYDKYYYLAVVICANAEYTGEPVNAYSAFGNLVCGKSVCEGYAKAFTVLCKEANLWCKYRHGMPEGEGHIWNMIKLESGIYNVDVTWCDTVEPYKWSFYENFCVPDSEFESHNMTEGVASTGVKELNPYS